MKRPDDEEADVDGTDSPVDEDDFPTDEQDLPSDEDLDALSSLDDVDVKDLLRGALRPPAGSVAPKLLSGVQRKLRVRSKGKFYGDGWSTAESPRSTYLITSILMLALIVLAVVVLVPWNSGTVP